MIAAAELEALVADVFTAAGCSAQEAGRIALHLVKANLAGHDSHGVVRVPRYIQMMREGMIFAGRQAQVLVDTPVLAVVDGRFGFGQTVAPQAVEIGVAKCRAMGLSAVALRNAGHIGRAPPAEETLLPGEPEVRTRAQRLQSGVPLPQETWTLLIETARSLGVEERRLPRAANAKQN